MRRQLTILLIVLCLSGLGASLLFSGCGSADVGDYEHEVTELIEAANQAREEISSILAEEELETEGERVEATIAALEEAVTALSEILEELAVVKVPQGMEEFHQALMDSYRSELAIYEGVINMLETGGQHDEEEGEGNAEEESDGPQEGAPHETVPVED